MNFLEFISRFNRFIEKFKELEYIQHTIDNLNFAEIQTIVLIAQKSHLTFADIARERNISRSAVTQLIKKMEHKGYIRRLAVDDKRFNLELTYSGQKVFQEHEKQHDYLKQQLEIIFSNCSQDFLTKISDLMTDVENLWDTLPWNEDDL